jgi:hypothetical protein
MNAANPTASAETIQALKEAVATAPENQIMRIVSLVDSLDGVGGDEDLLAPVRAKFNTLRLDRPLRYSRLLFTPLDPILTVPAQWGPGAATLPRSAIRPISAYVMAMTGDLTGDISRMIKSGSARDHVLIGDAGALLWPAAAAVLQTATIPPPAWKLAGLPETSFIPLAQGIAGCLAGATLIGMLADPTLISADIDQTLSAMLRQAAKTGPTAWGMMLALLLCTVPHAKASHDAVMVQGTSAALRPAASAALARVWSWIEEPLQERPRDLMEAAAALKQRATLLHWLAGEKAHRARAASLQTSLRGAMTLHLSDAIRERLLRPLAAMSAGPDDAAILQIEAEARGLRHLAHAMRALGGPAEGDAALRNAARAVSTSPALAVMDRARLVEILDDPAVAMTLLGGGCNPAKPG